MATTLVMDQSSYATGPPNVIKETILNINEGCHVMRQAVQAMNYLMNPDVTSAPTLLEDMEKNRVERSLPMKKMLSQPRLESDEVMEMFKRVRVARPDMGKEEAFKLAQELYHKIQVNPANERMVNEVLKDMAINSSVHNPKIKESEITSSNRYSRGDDSDVKKNTSMQWALEKATVLKSCKFPAMSRQTLLSLIYDLYERYTSSPGSADQVEELLILAGVRATPQMKLASSSPPHPQEPIWAKAMADEAIDQRGIIMLEEARDILMGNRECIDMDALEKTVRLMTRLKRRYPEWSKVELVTKLAEIYASLHSGTSTFGQWNTRVPPMLMSFMAPISKRSLPGPYAGYPGITDSGIFLAPFSKQSLMGQEQIDILDICRQIMEAVKAINRGVGQLHDNVDDMKLIDSALGIIPAPDLIKIIEKTEKARIKMEDIKSRELAKTKLDQGPKRGKTDKDGKSDTRLNKKSSSKGIIKSSKSEEKERKKGKGKEEEEEEESTTQYDSYDRKKKDKKSGKKGKKKSGKKDDEETSSATSDSHVAKDKKGSTKGKGTKDESKSKSKEVSKTDVNKGGKPNVTTDTTTKSKDNAVPPKTGPGVTTEEKKVSPGGINTVVKAEVNKIPQAPPPPLPKVAQLTPQVSPNQTPTTPVPSRPPAPRAPLVTSPPPGALRPRPPGPQPILRGAPPTRPTSPITPTNTPIRDISGPPRGPMAPRPPPRPPLPPTTFPRASPPLAPVRSSPQQNGPAMIPRASPPLTRGGPVFIQPTVRGPVNQGMPRPPPPLRGPIPSPPRQSPPNQMGTRGPSPPVLGSRPSPPQVRMPPPSAINPRMIPPRAPPSTPRSG